MANGKTIPVVLGVIAGLGAFLVFLKLAQGKTPPPPPGTANLYGTVTSAGQPLPDVRVRIPSPSGEYQDYTDANGYYEILDLDPGTYLVEFSLFGYVPEARTITITEGNNELNVTMVIETGPILAHLYGYITDLFTGEPLADVTITFVGETWVTGVDGFYEFFDIVPGDILQIMTLVKDGYISQTLPLHIGWPGDIRHDISMVPV